ncbi:MBL fold metallo-hydrolase [soil metagenome]
MILTFFTYLLSFFAFAAVFVVITDRSLRSKGYAGPVSDHFDGTKFFNIKDGVSQQRSVGLFSVLKWMLSREKNMWKIRTVEQTKPMARVEDKELVATFINHATVLLQTEGLNIITDPVYSERASPFSFAGPRRFAAPGVAFDDLPPIDIILLSHNHYDHLDLATMKRLVARDHPLVIVSLGNAAFLSRHGIKDAVELDWWQSHEINGDISVTAVPAQHFSSRALSDRNKTLWCGFVVSTPNGDIYFSGDTGYGPFVQQLADHFPHGFRLGLLPIGAYRPEWFMKEVHVSPDEAFTMHDQLKIKDVMAIHFGTFKLADDTQDEPATRLRELTQNADGSRRFLALKNGERMRVE